MVSIFPLLIAADVTPLTPEDNRQFILMKQFFSDNTEYRMQRLFGPYWTSSPVYDVCALKWKGIKCEDGIVAEVYYGKTRIASLRIRSLPPSVRKVYIADCNQYQKLQTRSLPRELRSINLMVNRYYGSLDLTTLPEKVEHVNFRNNHLSGPFILTQLPPDLKTLLLQSNKIRQHIFWYDNLPEGLEYIQLNWTFNKKVPFSVCAVNESRKADPKVFRGMPRKNIDRIK
mmetsp:Transcript_11635/g.17633  ORF Transcript_11635/g.17633 Transcript_11635/m.17633 type:complete len:229 (-) Transcript_11635:13-699(-)